MTTPHREPHALRIVMLSLHTSPLVQAGRGDAGGLNVYVDGITSALAALGHEVDIITTDVDRDPGMGPSRDRVITTDAGVRVHELTVGEPCRDGKTRLIDCVEDLAQRAVASIRQTSEAAVDVVHSHYWISGLVNALVAHEWGAAMVHTMHTMGAVKEENDPTAREDPRRHESEQRIADQVHMLTANTNQERDDLQRLFGVPEKKLQIVPPGTDLSIFRPAPVPPPPVQQDSASLGSTFRVTFAGRLQAHKGTHVAVAAVVDFHRMAPEVPVHLTICGQPSGDPDFDVTEQARQAGIAELVERIDPLPHEDLAALFRASDVVLMPSYSESFGLVALEAMACGTTVVAHAVGGLKDLITSGETGILLDTLDPPRWAQTLYELAMDPDGRASMGRAGAATAESYSWEASAAAMLTSYHRALGTRH